MCLIASVNVIIYRTNVTCDWAGSTSVGESILVGSWLRVGVRLVGGEEVHPAGRRPFTQVDVGGQTAALSAAVVQTFLHRPRRTVSPAVD